MKDYDLDLIQVLWVEDDPMVIEQYPLKAENFGLQLGLRCGSPWMVHQAC